MRKIAFVAALALLVGTATADQYFVRGGFNGWSTANELLPVGGHYEGVVSGLTPGAEYGFKVATADWATAFPPSDIKTTFASASTTFYYYPGTFADGWFPTENRVGYSNSGHTWEVMGSMNGWAAPFAMTDLGNGFYQTDIVVANPGTYEFKFRAAGNWNYNMGQHFGDNSPNITFDAWGTNEIHRFQIDLPNGRVRSFYLPEPASLLGLALLGMLVRRR
jgi:hypothetical protein